MTAQMAQAMAQATSSFSVEAAFSPGMDITRMSAAADPNMEAFEDRYQRHTGILDVLNP